MKLNLVTILLIGIAVLVTIQIDGCLDGKKENTDGYKVEIKLRDTLIAMEKRYRAEIENRFNERISLLDSQISDLRNKKTPIEIRYKNRTSFVNAMPDDEINRAIERRFGNAQ